MGLEGTVRDRGVGEGSRKTKENTALCTGLGLEGASCAEA